MNLNITIDDLRRGRYEAQKNQLLQHLVKKRAVIGDPEDGSLPSNIIRSELLSCMLQACSKNGVGVVHADSELGKSTAAKCIFKLSGWMCLRCVGTLLKVVIYRWRCLSNTLPRRFPTERNPRSRQTLPSTRTSSSEYRTDS